MAPSAFEDLWAQARRAHDAEIETLTLELNFLRRQVKAVEELSPTGNAVTPLLQVVPHQAKATDLVRKASPQGVRRVSWSMVPDLSDFSPAGRLDSDETRPNLGAQSSSARHPARLSEAHQDPRTVPSQSSDFRQRTLTDWRLMSPTMYGVMSPSSKSQESMQAPRECGNLKDPAEAAASLPAREASSGLVGSAGLLKWMNVRRYVGEGLTSSANRRAEGTDGCIRASSGLAGIPECSYTSSFISQRFSQLHRLSEWTKSIVTHPRFEFASATLVGVGSLFLCLESQCEGLEVEQELDLQLQTGPIEQCPAWIPSTCRWIGSALGLGITIEVLLNLAAYRSRFVLSGWNWIDTLISASWWISMVMDTDVRKDAQVIRFARLMRLLRFVRATKVLQTMDAIFLMTTAIRNSVEVLLWATLLLLLSLGALGLIVRQLLEDYYIRETADDEARATVFQYFGTFTRACFTMFELTLANYPPVSRYMAENVTEWFMLFALCHKMVMGFAFLGIINGVFMQETFKAAATDDRIMMSAKQKQMAVHTRKMKDLFARADPEGQGHITRDVFKQVVSQQQVKLWLASMELDAADADNLFTLLDKGNERITADDLVQGSARLRGAARSIDVASLLYAHRNLEHWLFEQLAGAIDVGQRKDTDAISDLLDLSKMPSTRSSVLARRSRAGTFFEKHANGDELLSSHQHSTATGYSHFTGCTVVSPLHSACYQEPTIRGCGDPLAASGRNRSGETPAAPLCDRLSHRRRSAPAADVSAEPIMEFIPAPRHRRRRMLTAPAQSYPDVLSRVQSPAPLAPLSFGGAAVPPELKMPGVPAFGPLPQAQGMPPSVYTTTPSTTPGTSDCMPATLDSELASWSCEPRRRRMLL